MESMDYQMESSSIPNVHFETLSPSRRCPYAPSPFPVTTQFRNPYHIQNGFAFVPSNQYYNQPLAWAHATYPLLPPPTPSHIGLRFGGLGRPGDYFPTRSSEQPLSQAINLPTRSMESYDLLAQDESMERMSERHGTNQANQSEPPETERSSSTGVDPTITRVGGGYNSTNVGSNEARSAPHILPPILNSGHGHTVHNTSQHPQRPPHLHSPRRGGHRPESSITSMSDEPPSNRELALQREPWIGAYLAHAAPLRNEDTLRMDDPARAENSVVRLRIIREMMNNSRQPSKKNGASKAAIDGLLKVPIADLKEDGRTCPICYNDYGVENEEGVKEFPIKLPKCKHTFGETCLKKWLEDSSTCPSCRDQLPSDGHRAPRRSVTEAPRRSVAEARRIRAEMSSSHIAFVAASERQTARHSGLPAQRRMDWADQMIAMRGDEAELDHQQSLFESPREAARLEPAAVPARSTARRARGRASSGRGSHQSDYADMRMPSMGDSQQVPMRMPSMGDSQQVPMRIPVGSTPLSTPESYGQSQNIGSSHNTRRGAPNAINPDRYPNLAYHAQQINSPQNEDTGYRPGLYRSRPEDWIDPPPGHPGFQAWQRRQQTLHEWQQRQQAWGIGGPPPLLNSPERTVDALGERRTLHPMHERPQPSSQENFTNQPPAERQSNRYNFPATRGVYSDPDNGFNLQGVLHEQELRRAQFTALINRNNALVGRGNHDPNGMFSGSMQPRLAPATHGIADGGADYAQPQREPRHGDYRGEDSIEDGPGSQWGPSGP